MIYTYPSAGINYEDLKATDEIVLDDESRPFRAHYKLLDDFARQYTLFRIEVGGGLVDQEHVCGYTQDQNNGDSLELSSRKSNAEISTRRHHR